MTTNDWQSTTANKGLPKWGLKNKGSSSVFQFIFSAKRLG